jgi:hypothetical protein
VHALAGKLQVADLARFVGLLDRIDADARLVRHAGGDGFVEVRTLLILNEYIAGDLDLVRVGIRRVRHLPDHARILRVGGIDDRERHRRGAEMRDVDVAPLL